MYNIPACVTKIHTYFTAIVGSELSYTFILIFCRFNVDIKSSRLRRNTDCSNVFETVYILVSVIGLSFSCNIPDIPMVHLTTHTPSSTEVQHFPIWKKISGVIKIIRYSVLLFGFLEYGFIS